jgi:hypothetical protein
LSCLRCSLSCAWFHPSFASSVCKHQGSDPMALQSPTLALTGPCPSCLYLYLFLWAEFGAFVAHGWFCVVYFLFALFCLSSFSLLLCLPWLFLRVCLGFCLFI